MTAGKGLVAGLSPRGQSARTAQSVAARRARPGILRQQCYRAFDLVGAGVLSAARMKPQTVKFRQSPFKQVQAVSRGITGSVAPC